MIFSHGGEQEIEGGGNVKGKKGSKMCYVPVSTSHKGFEHCVLQTCINNKITKQLIHKNKKVVSQKIILYYNASYKGTMLEMEVGTLYHPFNHILLLLQHLKSYYYSSNL